MVLYTVRRLLYAIVVLLALMTVIFIVVHIVGNPASLMLNPDATPEGVQRLSEKLGYADPLYIQYKRFMGSVLRGDMGDSLWMHVPALPLAVERLPPTLMLAGIVIGISMTIGIGVGIVAAIRPGSSTDRLVTVLSLAGVSLPEFWVGLMLIFFMAIYLGVLPTSGYGEPKHLVLPVLTLLALPIGRIAQVTRTVVIDELARQYVVTARAKGLPNRVVWLVHVLKNAAISIVTLVGDEMAHMVNGVVVVETIFAWPGIGLLTIQAIQRRDLPVVEAAVLVVAVMVVLINLVVDLLYTFLDPRIRYR